MDTKLNRNFPVGLDTETIKIHRCSDGGLLYEFYRKEDFGQLAVRTVLPAKTVGGHSHSNMHEWWLVFKGKALMRLEYPGGIRVMQQVFGVNPKIVPLPPGTGHDIKNIGENDMAFIFWAEKLYDPETHTKEDWSWD